MRKRQRTFVYCIKFSNAEKMSIYCIQIKHYSFDNGFVCVHILFVCVYKSFLDQGASFVDSNLPS